MRIIAGEFGGRRLHAPKGEKIRPTTDRVREAVFSIISHHVSGSIVLDIFAGTGALGLEALSRGASKVVFIDRSPDAIRIIRKNIETCGVRDRAEVLHGSAQQVISRLAVQGCSFHLIFMDPPYGKGFLERTLMELYPVADSETVVVSEHSSKESSPLSCGEWQRIEERKYGDTAISIYMKKLPDKS